MPQDVCYADLKFIIEFVYKGEIDVSQAELQVRDDENVALLFSWDYALFHLHKEKRRNRLIVHSFFIRKEW